MTNFICKICNNTLINRFHECGKADSVHHVEIIGGGWWGRSDFSPGGFKDRTM